MNHTHCHKQTEESLPEICAGYGNIRQFTRRQSLVSKCIQGTIGKVPLGKFERCVKSAREFRTRK
jgi:hypothetical protein